MTDNRYDNQKRASVKTIAPAGRYPESESDEELMKFNGDDFQFPESISGNEVTTEQRGIVEQEKHEASSPNEDAKDLRARLTEEIHQKELARSQLEQISKELREKEEKLLDESIARDEEHIKLLGDLNLVKEKNVRLLELIDLRNKDVADLEGQVDAHVQRAESLQNALESTAEKLRDSEKELALRMEEIRRLLSDAGDAEKEATQHRKDVVDLSEQLATQIHERELIQHKLDSANEKLSRKAEERQNLLDEATQQAAEKRKLIDAAALKHAEYHRSKEELIRLTEENRLQVREIADLRSNLNMHVSLTTVVILSVAGFVGWNYLLGN